MIHLVVQNPYEKLLLRTAKNDDLRRGAQWLVHLAQLTLGDNAADDETKEGVRDLLESYGDYAETDDPRQLLLAEIALSKMVESENNPLLQGSVEQLIAGIMQKKALQ